MDARMISRSAKKWIGAVGLTCASLVPQMALGTNGIRDGYPDMWQALDPREVAMLPEYCKYSQVFRSSVQAPDTRVQIKRWTAIMGPTFHAVHHYCFGLLKTNRALLIATTDQFRKFYLDASIGEFDYVINRAPRDFILLPEILTKKGENLLRLGRDVPGVDSLQQAIALKPDYWPPYTVLADYYKDHGRPAEARTILEKALEHSPDAPAVKRRLADLSPQHAVK
jgi:tetratricopeptide (TPR) repeat protein